MAYTYEKVSDQKLAYAITTEHNNEQITFIVVCANNSDEIPELVEFHLNSLNNSDPVYETSSEPVVDLHTLVAQQQELIQSLTNRIAALEGN